MKGITAILLGVLLLGTDAFGDSLFNSRVANNGTMVSNRRMRFQPGDIITVMVQENVDASTQSNTDTKKESDIQAQAAPNANTFLIAKKPDGLELIPQERLPNWDISVENEHKGTGRTRRANRLTTTVSCTVVRVHSNGNIDLVGEKQVTVNREDSQLFVSGTARSRDVSPSNMIESSKLANANIELRGRGPLWNNERRGLLTRMLDWISPF